MVLKYLNLLVSFILHKYFQSELCVFLLTDQKFELYDIKASVPVVILRNENAKFAYHLLFLSYGCQGIILHVEEPHTVFTELEHQIRMHSDRFNKRKYLILPTQQGHEMMMKLFETPLNYVADVLVVVLESAWQTVPYRRNKYILDSGPGELYSFYTHQYIGYEKGNQPILLNKWSSNSGNFTALDNLYPDKLDNQMGRKLRIATFTYLPYSIPSKLCFSQKT